MPLRPSLVRHVRRPIVQIGRRSSIHQAPGTQRVMRAQMAQDFRKVRTLVFLSPLMALGYITSFSLLGFFGIQWWVEHVEMAPGEATPWEWEKEMEDWSGGSKGGTDPSLGFIPRIGIRSACLFQHWAGSTSQSGPLGPPSSFPSVILSGPDRGYQLAERQLAWVIRYLKEQNKPVPKTLILRHADLLTRLGTTQALKDAKLEYIHLHKSAPPESLEAAQLALKIGNLASLDSSDDTALDYYLQAFFYKGDTEELAPLKQRHYANAAVQLSNKLRVASEIQEGLMGRVACFFLPSSLNPTQPEEIAHFIFLAHRYSVLVLHYAENAYAQAYGPDPKFTVEKAIPQAIGILEEIAKTALIPFIGFCKFTDPYETTQAEGSPQQNPVPVDNQPTKEFSGSRSLREPTASLLRDSRRVALHSCRLIGMIQEDRDGKAAIEAYEMALKWAGMTVADGKKLGIPESELIDVQRRLDSLKSRMITKL